MGGELQGRLDCTCCGIVKARETFVPKVSKISVTKEREIFLIDTTGQYYVNTGVKFYCMCDLDDFKDMSWLHFEKIKRKMVKFVSNLLENLKGKGIKVEYIRCDNAVEHMSKLRTFVRKR